MKTMASAIVKGVEKKTGNLNLPSQCQDLFMNLLGDQQ